MRTYKGVVFEKKNAYMVFLTEEGEFLHGTPVSGSPNVGEEAEFQLFVAARARKTLQSRYLWPVLAAAMMLIIIFATLFPSSNDVMAYVQLESESALEIGLNKDGEIVNFRYWDEEAPISKKLLDTWKGMPINSVLGDAVNQLSETEDGKELSITAIYSKRKNGKTKEIVQHAISNVRSEYVGESVNVLESTVRDRKRANKNNMPVHDFKVKSNKKVDESSPPGKGQDKSSVPEEMKQKKPGQNEEKSKNTPAAEKNLNKKGNAEKNPKSKKQVEKEDLPQSKSKSNPSHDPAEGKRNNENKNNKPNSANKSGKNPQNQKKNKPDKGPPPHAK